MISTSRCLITKGSSDTFYWRVFKVCCVREMLIMFNYLKAVLRIFKFIVLKRDLYLIVHIFFTLLCCYIKCLRHESHKYVLKVVAVSTFCLVRNLQNIYELLVGHLPPFGESVNVTNLWMSHRSYWFSGRGLGTFLPDFFYFRVVHWWRWLSLVVTMWAFLGFPSWAPSGAGGQWTGALGSRLLSSSWYSLPPTLQLLCTSFSLSVQQGS